MRKIYLSFLGTSDYIACNYLAPGQETVQNVRFVQEATIQWFCRDWNENDQLVILTTNESRAKNWLDNGHRDREGKKLDREGLRTRLNRMDLLPRVREVLVASGKNQQEIMDIFQTMYDLLKPGDQMYLDLTHALRHLPLLALAMLNYAKAMKEIQVHAIGYGAMEALGPSYEVSKMELRDRNVPVFDLLPYDRILEWSSAIDRFVSAGDAKGVAALANMEVKPVLVRTQGRDEEAASVRNLAYCLEKFSRTITTCRGKMITETASSLRQAISSAIGQETVTPLRPLLRRLETSMAKFNGESINDGIAAARWCLEHNLVQQGFTILEETIFSWILRQATGLAPEEEINRTLVNQAVTITLKSIPFDDWKRESREHREIAQQLISWLEPNIELLENMRNLAGDRNDINHAGMVNGPMRPEKFDSRLKEYIEFFSRLIESRQDEEPA
ncbi:TIGR02221 family CRISPR-associated protein [Desulfolithobacter sp.]